jgi:ArsR family metal-binding transcriptional regulator
MDMYWAHVVQTDLKKYKQKKNNNDTKKNNEKKDTKEKKDDDIKEHYVPKYNCGNCGQNKYFCQCISLKYFNPEKDIY